MAYNSVILFGDNLSCCLVYDLFTSKFWYDTAIVLWYVVFVCNIGIVFEDLLVGCWDFPYLIIPFFRSINKPSVNLSSGPVVSISRDNFVSFGFHRIIRKHQTQQIEWILKSLTIEHNVKINDDALMSIYRFPWQNSHWQLLIELRFRKTVKFYWSCVILNLESEFRLLHSENIIPAIAVMLSDN